jgi:hypothetical protein
MVLSPVAELRPFAAHRTAVDLIDDRDGRATDVPDRRRHPTLCARHHQDPAHEPHDALAPAPDPR